MSNKICNLFKNCCNSSQMPVNNYRRLLAFTLAEVLIVLVVIGVVASLIIPAIIRDTQDAEFHAAYKKGLATFSQAFMRIRMDNADTLAGVFQTGNHTGFNQTLSQYLNIAEYSSTDVIMSKPTWHNIGDYKKLNGQQVENWVFTCGGCPSARLQDGSFFIVLLNWSTNDLSTCNLGGSKPKNGLCFNIMYDVNGKKPPNTIGKDIYLLTVYKDKVVPADWWSNYGSIDESSCTSIDTGYGCAIKYIKE